MGCISATSLKNSAKNKDGEKIDNLEKRKRVRFDQEDEIIESERY